jgi:hypothetical protein
MHVDRLRYLIHHNMCHTLKGATELANSAPNLLAQIEELKRELAKRPAITEGQG